jgi:hypothetical protein
MVGNQVRRDRLSSDARLGNDRDDPARRVAELNFPDRMDQPRDERSLYHHGCLLTAMLVIAAASRDFWIRRLESLHINQAAARETVPGRQRLHLFGVVGMPEKCHEQGLMIRLRMSAVSRPLLGAAFLLIDI